MRVGFISQWLETGGDGFVGGIASALAEHGAKVTAVVGTATDKGAPRPWRLQRHRDEFDKFCALRYPYFRSQDGSALKRALTYVSFSAVTGIGALRALRGTDVVLVYSSPATAAWAGMVCQKLWGTPYVLLVQDLWPDSVFASGFITGGRFRKLAEWSLTRFVNASYRNAAAVVAISPGMRQVLLERGVPDEKLSTIYNWADETVMAQPISLPARTEGSPLQLMYAGNLGFAQNLGNVIEAIAMVPSGKVHLTLVGEGAAEAELRRIAHTVAPGFVSFHSRVTVGELRELMTGANFHLISLADEEVFRITLPSKLQFLLAAGAPILCVAPGEVSRIVESEGVGVVAEPANLQSLVQALMRACDLEQTELDRMARSARALYETKMARAINGSKLMQVVAEASRKREPSSPLFSRRSLT